MVRRSSSASTPGAFSISSRISFSSLGSAARPMRKSLLSRPSLTATTTSNTPMAMEAPPSQTGDPVTCRRASQPQRGQPEAGHRRAVFEQGRLDRRVGAGAHVIEHLHLAPAGFAPELDQHPDQGGALGQAGDAQDHVGEERVVAVPVPECEHALEDGESGPGDEDAERGQQRPEVPFLAVTERVTLIGGPFAAVHGGQQERLVERVRRRVGRLASMALEPTMIPAASLIAPTKMFAAPAMSTVPRVDARSANAAPLWLFTCRSASSARGSARYVWSGLSAGCGVVG